MADYSSYRLDGYAWVDAYIAQMGQEAFHAYRSKVERALEALSEGRYYAVDDVREEDRELFVKLCCHYITGHPEYYFSDDYSRIYREKVYYAKE